MHPVLGLVEDDRSRRLEDIVRHLEAVEVERAEELLPLGRLPVVEGRKAVEELRVRISRRLHQLCVHLVLLQDRDPLGPLPGGLAQRDPDVGVDEVAPLDALLRLVGDGDRGPRERGERLRPLDDPLVRREGLRPDEPHVHSHQRSGKEERVRHVVPGIAEKREREVLERRSGVLFHRQEIREHLCRVGLVRQSVVDRDPGVLREDLDALLREAPVLDGVVHPAEDAGGVLHRLLVADLRTRRIQGGHAHPLVERRHLEGAAGPGRGLLENDAEVLPREAGDRARRVRGALQVAGEVEEEAELGGRKVGHVEEAAISQVHGHLGLLEESKRPHSAPVGAGRRPAAARPPGRRARVRPAPILSPPRPDDEPPFLRVSRRRATQRPRPRGRHARPPFGCGARPSRPRAREPDVAGMAPRLRHSLAHRGGAPCGTGSRLPDPARAGDRRRDPVRLPHADRRRAAFIDPGHPPRLLRPPRRPRPGNDPDPRPSHGSRRPRDAREGREPPRGPHRDLSCRTVDSPRDDLLFREKAGSPRTGGGTPRPSRADAHSRTSFPERKSPLSAFPGRNRAGPLRHGLLLGSGTEVLAEAGCVHHGGRICGGPDSESDLPRSLHGEAGTRGSRPRRLRSRGPCATRRCSGVLGKPRPDPRHAPGERRRHPVSFCDLLLRRVTQRAAEASATRIRGASPTRVSVASRPRSSRRRSSTMPRTTTNSTSERTPTATAASPVRGFPARPEPYNLLHETSPSPRRRPPRARSLSGVRAELRRPDALRALREEDREEPGAREDGRSPPCRTRKGEVDGRDLGRHVAPLRDADPSRAGPEGGHPDQLRDQGMAARLDRRHRRPEAASLITEDPFSQEWVRVFLSSWGGGLARPMISSEGWQGGNISFEGAIVLFGEPVDVRLRISRADEDHYFEVWEEKLPGNRIVPIFEVQAVRRKAAPARAK